MGPARKPLHSVKITGDLDAAPVHLWLTEKIEVVVFRKAGRLRIFSSICPHMGAQLQCNQRRSSVSCPWHGLCFQLGNRKEETQSDHPRYKRIREYDGEIVDGELHVYE